MRTQIDQALRMAYSVREGKLLATNAVLSAFVAVSNGGALLIATARDLPEAGEILAQTAITLPLAVVVLTAFYPFTRSRSSCLRLL